jgi:hypothetical protein
MPAELTRKQCLLADAGQCDEKSIRIGGEVATQSRSADNMAVDIEPS